jgi:ubiquinone/menaquinone biosynthesis C-methylase UbiE
MSTWQDPQDSELRYFLDYAEIDGQRVLEVGVGEGRLTWRYAAQTRRVTGIEPDADRIADALQERPPGLPVDLVLSRAEALPFPREMFDRAVLSWSL